jgi:hypothetical protein
MVYLLILIWFINIDKFFSKSFVKIKRMFKTTAGVDLFRTQGSKSHFRGHGKQLCLFTANKLFFLRLHCK